MGNHTVNKTPLTRSDGRQVCKIDFDKNQSGNCPLLTECAGKAKYKTLGLGINTTDINEYRQQAMTPDFLEKYKKRASHEWKNGEIKRFHGMARSKGFTLRSFNMQVKFTALAVNLKRIAALLRGLFQCFFQSSLYYRQIRLKAA